MKEFRDMTREGLNEAFITELLYYKESFTTNRVKWLCGVRYADFTVLMIYNGYLMAMKDCGKPIGDLKLILEFILEKESLNN